MTTLLLILTSLFFSQTRIFCDVPENFQISIQDPASPVLEGMLGFHHYLMFFLIFYPLARAIKMHLAYTMPSNKIN